YHSADDTQQQYDDHHFDQGEPLYCAHLVELFVLYYTSGTSILCATLNCFAQARTMQPHSNLRPIIAAISRFGVYPWLAALLVIAFAVYAPGLSGDYIFDDFLNIVTNTKVHMDSLAPSEIAAALTSGIASSLGRPLSMLSFGINHYFTGLE